MKDSIKLFISRMLADPELLERVESFSTRDDRVKIAPATREMYRLLGNKVSLFNKEYPGYPELERVREENERGVFTIKEYEPKVNLVVTKKDLQALDIALNGNESELHRDIKRLLDQFDFLAE